MFTLSIGGGPFALFYRGSREASSVDPTEDRGVGTNIKTERLFINLHILQFLGVFHGVFPGDTPQL